MYILALSGGVFTSFYLLYRRLKKTEMELLKTKAMLNRVVIERFMFSEQVNDDSIFKEGLITLSKRLFNLLKKKYNLSATNYSELVDELDYIDMKKELKDKLKEFFNVITLIEYSRESLTESKKRALKQQAIELIKSMGPSPVGQE